MTERTRSDNTQIGNWRRWAVLLTLHSLRNHVGPTHLIAQRTNTNGWRVWPENQREWTPTCYRTLCSLERHRQVERLVYSGAREEVTWSLTAIGRDLVERHLIDNPHITPEKFEEGRNVR